MEARRRMYHYLTGTVWFFWLMAWYSCALAFIMSPRCRGGLIGWVERVGEFTGSVARRRASLPNLALTAAVYSGLAVFVGLFLAFITPVLMVAYFIFLASRRR